MATISTRESQRRAAVVAPLSPELGKNVVVELIIVDIWDSVVLRSQRIITPEQQLLPMKSSGGQWHQWRMGRLELCVPDWANEATGAEKLRHFLRISDASKYMYELCSLLMHIPTYYNIISCYNHVLWGFSIDLSYFGYNSVGQENPVLRIFKF
jgi:hypothetical protein